MADNVIANAGSGGATFATKDIGGVQYARSMMCWGGAGAANDVSASNPLPVVQTGALPAGSNNIGNVTIAALPDEGQQTMANSISVAIASNQSSIPVAATLGAETTKIIGTVNIAGGQSVGVSSIAAGDNNIGNVDVVTVPADPFGLNADAASATGSISAKLRHLAASGIAGMTTLPAGSNAIGKLAANSGVDIGDVDVLSLPANASVNLNQVGGQSVVSGGVNGSVAAGGPTAADAAIAANPVTTGGRASDAVPTAMSANGDVVNAWLGRRGEQIVSVEPNTFGGLSTYHLVSAASTNANNIKSSAGKVYGWYIYNSNAAARKVAFHDSASSPTAGSSVKLSLVIPPGGAANVHMSAGIAFSSGIGITTTTGLADNDTAAVAANDLVINIFYK